MKLPIPIRILPLAILSALVGPTPNVTAQPEPKHWKNAPTPVLGWNSWDIFGTTITEQQVKEQADAMAKDLLPSGYQYLTVDIQWYEPESKGHHYQPNAVLTMDDYGRLTPGLKKFPSAADGKGFKPLADYVHSKGLKFGIHIMRGIPRQAVTKNTPVLGTEVKAQEIALTQSICNWNPDMFGVDATKPGGQAYYDSIFKLYAEWGVDLVKVDDISHPYDAVQKAEIEAIRKAIDKTGRPIVLSLSPGAAPIHEGTHVMMYANQWRITGDFWDNWDHLKAMFERLHAWSPFRGPGHFPDADMLPIGTIGFNRPTKLTKDEQYTLMSLWAIARSPLIFGGDMTKLDDFTKEMLTNPEMLAVNQKSTNNRQVSRDRNLTVWAADVPESNDKYVALFNAQSKEDVYEFASADYASPVIRGPGGSQEIMVSVAGGKRLVLFVEDGGDSYAHDHAVWQDPVLHGPKGDLKLTTLKWISAKAGWGEPRVDRTSDNQPLVINGQPASGIGTASVSKIIYDLPEGYETFTVKGVATREHGTVNFGVMVDKSEGPLTDKEVKVEFAKIGIQGKAKVRDLWAHKDLGIFEGSFSQVLRPHGAGLYRVTPTDEGSSRRQEALSSSCAPSSLKPPYVGCYVTNRSPLQPRAFLQLPLGSVRAKGWLENQLRVQVDGVTSWLWSAFNAEGYDANPPYHQEGVVALAGVTGDPRLMALARGYVERRLTGKPGFTANFPAGSIMRFMMEYQEMTGDVRIIPWMRHWYQNANWKVPEKYNWDYAGREEHLLALYWLYNRTGDAQLLECAQREFGGPSKYTPAMANSVFPVGNVNTLTEAFLDFPNKRPSKHGVTITWKLKYPGIYWQQDPKPEYRDAVFKGLAGLDQYFGQIAGRFAGHEWLPPIETGKSPIHGTELCNSVEMGYNMEKLFEIFGEPALGDRLEALAFNTWPGQMSADTWLHQYDTQANQVAVTVANRGWDNDSWANIYGFMAHWTCCLANKHQAWPRYVKNMWMATPDNGLVAFAYGPSEVTAKAGTAGQEVTITQNTEYPFDGEIVLNIKTANPVKFPLYLRIPAWAEGAAVSAGSKPLSAKPGTLVKVEREWKAGDKVTIRFPMPVRVEERYNKALAIKRGPLYFCLRVGESYREAPANPRINGRLMAQPVRERSGFPLFDWEIVPSTPWNYALSLDPAKAAERIRVQRNPVGSIPFAHKNEPILLRSSDPANAEFRAEVSTVVPHPGEIDLAVKPAWRLAPANEEQWVGFNRTTYKQNEPVVLKVKGRLLPGWKMQQGLQPLTKQMVDSMAEPTPVSPVTSTEPLVDLELIPYGCTRLRISEFPVLQSGTSKP